MMPPGRAMRPAVYLFWWTLSKGVLPALRVCHPRTQADPWMRTVYAPLFKICLKLHLVQPGDDKAFIAQQLNQPRLPRQM